jgi:predicted flavoprotein YhiN
MQSCHGSKYKKTKHTNAITRTEILITTPSVTGEVIYFQYLTVAHRNNHNMASNPLSRAPSNEAAEVAHPEREESEHQQPTSNELKTKAANKKVQEYFETHSPTYRELAQVDKKVRSNAC